MDSAVHNFYVDHLEASLLAYCRYRFGSDATVRRAIALAKESHSQQIRDGGEPYIIHPLRVANHYLVVNPSASESEVATAILHDVLEDNSALTRARLAEIMGDEIAAAVDILSKKTSEKFLSAEEYKIGIINASPFVRIIKLCDRLDNLISLRSCPDSQKRHRYLTRTEAYYEAIAKDTDPTLFRVILEEISRLKSCE
jgi:(p)ppGpp synthase/HD superfamily hydrolase